MGSGRKVDLRTVKVLETLLGGIGTRKTFLIVCAVAVIFAWIPDGIYQLIGLLISDRWIKTFVQISVGIGLLVLLFCYIRKLSIPDIEVITREDPNRKFKVIIIPLSKPERDPAGFKSFEDVEASKHNWIMPLRVIKKFSDTLEKVVIVASRESFPHFEDFKELVEEVIPHFKGEVVLYGKVLDFKDIEGLSEEFNSIYRRLKDEGYRDKDVAIDVTGGTKPVSIAGAAVTLSNPSRYFLYTYGDDIKIFNAEGILRS